METISDLEARALRAEVARLAHLHNQAETEVVDLTWQRRRAEEESGELRAEVARLQSERFELARDALFDAAHVLELCGRGTNDERVLLRAAGRLRTLAGLRCHRSVDVAASRHDVYAALMSLRSSVGHAAIDRIERVVDKALDDSRVEIARLSIALGAVRIALDLDGDRHASGNLASAIVDLTRQGRTPRSDAVCIETLRRVRDQITGAERAVG